MIIQLVNRSSILVTLLMLVEMLQDGGYDAEIHELVAAMIEKTEDV